MSSERVLKAHNNRVGLALGLLGVMAFSQTLPMTKLAVASLTPAVVGFGRSAAAGLISIFVLLVFRKRLPLPSIADLLQLFIIGLCVVIGFPVLTSIALKTSAASHGAIVISFIPIATAIFASRGKRLPTLFWISAGFGSLVVALFVVISSRETATLADIYYVFASVVVAYGYAHGARFAEKFKGWGVICWALVTCLPVTLPLSIYFYFASVQVWNPTAVGAFLYITLVSQLLGFIAWYAGLSIGDPALVSQVQLAQGFLTVLGSSLYLGERISTSALFCLCFIIASIFVSRRALQRTG